MLLAVIEFEVRKSIFNVFDLSLKFSCYLRLQPRISDRFVLAFVGPSIQFQSPTTNSLTQTCEINQKESPPLGNKSPNQIRSQGLFTQKSSSFPASSTPRNVMSDNNIDVSKLHRKQKPKTQMEVLEIVSPNPPATGDLLSVT